MPNKLFIRVEPEAQFVGATPDFVDISRLPLDGAQSYLVQASGILALQAGVMMRMRLEVRRFNGAVLVSQEADYINTYQQFVLVVAATLPSEGGGGSGAPASAIRPAQRRATATRRPRAGAA